MDVKQRIDRLYVNLMSTTSIPAKLGSKIFVEDEQYTEVIEDIEFLIEHFKEDRCIPKKLAVCFVDMYSGFSYPYGYSEEERGKFELFGMKLHLLALSLFNN